MRRTIAVIILSLLMLSSFGLARERQFEYKNAHENDRGIYIHLKILLLYSEMTLDKIIAEGNESLDYANNVETKLNMTRDEVEFYKSFGVKTKIEEYLPPFLELGKSLKDMALGQRLFLENIKVIKDTDDYHAYVNASLGLERMRDGISSAENALDAIETFEFVDEDNSTLTLDTSSLREKLEKIKTMYLGYEKILSAQEVTPPELLILYASNLNPLLYENVTFYGHAPDFESVNLHVENKTIVLKVNNNSFSYVYSFERPGKYEVFATGVRNGSIEKSNVLEVNVLKIPTRVILSAKGSAYINESINVTGLLLDHYGKPLAGKEVLGEFDGKEFAVTTSNEGSFSFNITSGEGGRKIVNVTYPGSEVYAESSASIGVVFLKYPVRIIIKTDRENIKEGEKVKVTGEITGVDGEVPIEIYVDGNPQASFYASKNFEVEIGFNSTGRHDVYAYFPGNRYYDRAKSNVIIIEVVEFSTMDFLLAALVLALFGGIWYLARNVYTKRKESVSDEEFVKLMKTLEEAEGVEEGERKLKSLREMYRGIYQRLLKRYNLKPSITPRELVTRLRGESFTHHLEKLTDLHERYVYGKKPLKRQGVREFLRNVAGFIVSFVVGEEL